MVDTGCVKPTELEEAQGGTRVRVRLDYREPQQQGPIRHAFAAGASGAELAPIHRTAEKSSFRKPGFRYWEFSNQHIHTPA